MKNRHDAELERLKEQHKSELMIAREEFESFKRKHDEDMQRIHKQRYEMVEQRNLVSEDMRQIHKEWIPVQVRVSPDTIMREGVGKRRKKQHLGDEMDVMDI